jgi:hypothetical protein
MKKKTMNNKTRKKRNSTYKKKADISVSVRILPLKFKLYASKSYDGNAILEHSRKLEQKYHKKCIPDNLTWLGSYSVAKSYERKDTNLYEWEIKTPTRLVNINKKNEKYFKRLFLNTSQPLTPLIKLSNVNMKTVVDVANNMKFEHPYFTMSIHERAWHEFAFAYGYLLLKEQYEFLSLIKFLLANNFITINMRDGTSILSKIDRDIYYYRTANILPYKHKEKYNRISFYQFDQSVLTNLCSLLPKNISGVYQPNVNSFWFPNLVVYQMNIEEYVLFNPHHNLTYVTMRE